VHFSSYLPGDTLARPKAIGTKKFLTGTKKYLRNEAGTRYIQCQVQKCTTTERVQLTRNLTELTLSEMPLTISVPEAGRKYFGLSRNASYAAAERGEIPVVKIGKLLRVPVRALEQLLNNPQGKDVA
jgi:hypothetical protein